MAGNLVGLHFTAALVVGYSARLGGVTRPMQRPVGTARRGFVMASDGRREAVNDAKSDGHQLPEGGEPSDEEKEIQQRVMAHQKTAARLTTTTEARSIVEYSNGYGVISTVCKQFEGYPNGGVVGYAPGPSNGLPVFFFSTLSGHTQDLLAQPKASLTVTASGFTGAADGRLNLMGSVEKLEDSDAVASAREAYLRKHPDAFWIDFGDFSVRARARSPGRSPKL